MGEVVGHVSLPKMRKPGAGPGFGWVRMWLGSAGGRTVDAVVVERDILDDGLMAVRRDPVDVGDDAFPSLVDVDVFGNAVDSIAAVAATLAFSIASASDVLRW